MIIYRMKTFARKDYEGLSEEGKKILREQRSIQAKELMKKRSKINQKLKDDHIRNAAVFGPMSSDPGNPGKLATLNESSIKQRNRAYERALEESKKDANELRKNAMIKPAKNPTNTTLPTTPNPKQKEVTEGFLKRNWNKLGTGGKIAAVAIPTVAAIGTGMAIKKNKKEQE